VTRGIARRPRSKDPGRQVVGYPRQAIQAARMTQGRVRRNVTPMKMASILSSGEVHVAIAGAVWSQAAAPENPVE
jgi:hypothetical protein